MPHATGRCGGLTFHQQHVERNVTHMVKLIRDGDTNEGHRARLIDAMYEAEMEERRAALEREGREL